MPTPMPDVALFSEGFSAAFRKALDTPLSVIAFHALRGLDPDDWDGFVAHVMAGMGRRRGFDAGTLRDACVAYAEDWRVMAIDPEPGRPRGPNRERLLHIWRASLRMMTSAEWLEATRFVRSGIPGDETPDRVDETPDRVDELSLLPVTPDDAVVTVTLERDGVEVASVTRRAHMEHRGGDLVRVTRNDVRVLGGIADPAQCVKSLDEAVQAARYAANTARAQAVVARVDPARVRSVASTPMGQDLSPDHPADATLIALGVTGAVLHRQPVREEDWSEATEYLLLDRSPEGLRLRRWTVPDEGDPRPGSERMHARAVAKLVEKGLARLGTPPDRDRTHVTVELRQEEDRVTWTTTVGVSERVPVAYPELADLASGVLATAQGSMDGRLAGMQVTGPTP